MDERTTIYLDDAINLLEELETKRLQGDVGLLYAPMLKGLKALPSAQPEQEEDCDTCIYLYDGDAKCNYCRVGYPSYYERRTDEAD